MTRFLCIIFFFFNDTATTEIYTLSLHDALPIYKDVKIPMRDGAILYADVLRPDTGGERVPAIMNIGPYQKDRRSEEHTSELQSRQYLVCRLLLEKKKKQKIKHLT